MIKSIILCDKLRQNGVSIGQIVDVSMAIQDIDDVQLKIKAKIIEVDGAIGLQFLTKEDAENSPC